MVFISFMLTKNGFCLFLFLSSDLYLFTCIHNITLTKNIVLFVFGIFSQML